MKLTLLVVDPDDASRRSLNIALKDDFRVLLAKDSTEALNLAKSHRIHVALVESVLPWMSGIELKEDLKRAYRSMEVLFMSASDAYRSPQMSEGPQHVYKPFDLPALRATVRAAGERSRSGIRPLAEAKLILVGRGGVGKTSLIKRLVKNDFDARELETKGIEIQPWDMTLPDGDPVRIHIWDFGGQEMLHATHQFFLTEETLYLLVLTGREDSQSRDAEYWLQLIRSLGGRSKVIVVLNKSAEHPFDLNRGLLIEKYPCIADFVCTDCRTKSGLETLRNLLLAQVQNLEHRKLEFPADWFEIKDRLSGMKENFLTWDQYQKICLENDVADPKAQRDLIKYLHVLGIALNYSDDIRLRDTNVLNPRWVTEGIYGILRVAKEQQWGAVLDPARLLHNLVDQTGSLEFRHLKRIFDELDDRMDSSFEVIMRGFSNETWKRWRRVCAESKSLGEAELAERNLVCKLLTQELNAIVIGDSIRVNNQIHDKALRSELKELIETVLIEPENGPASNQLMLDSHPAPNSQILLDPKHYPGGTHEFLFGLMEKFQLCFQLPGVVGRYLVPELLGENQPAEIQQLLATPGLGFRYQYDVLPEGLVPRFIVQTHAYR